MNIEAASVVKKDTILENPEIAKQKKNISELFELNTELSTIGSQEQYLEYIKTIFPESKVSDIVWHASLKDFKNESFKPESHFGTKNQAKSRIGFLKQVTTDFQAKEYFYPTVLNIKNIKQVDDADYNWKEEIKKAREENFDGFVYENKGEILNDVIEKSYVIFDSSQAHILGSDSDTQKFKKFILKE